MDTNETIQKLTKACQDLMQMVNELKEENTFLTDTICNQGMGKISTERRQLLTKVAKAESDSKTAVAEANAVKSEYEQKLDKITILIKDVKSKQDDIDSYINSEAENKIADTKADYLKHKKNNDNILAKYKAENDKLLQEQLNKYKRQRKVIIMCGVICIITGILGFIF